jgi:NADH-quinone oxidoreductase subunit N
MLLPFALATPHGVTVNNEAFAASVLYILIYGVMNLGAFGIVIGMTREAPGMLISDFAGFGQRAAGLAVAMTLFMVSLAGVPPMAGFWGKFFIFTAAIHRGGFGPVLAGAMVVNSVISVVYYFAIVRAMWLLPAAEPVRPVRVPWLVRGVVAAAAGGVAVIGVYPELLAQFPRVSTLIVR